MRILFSINTSLALLRSPRAPAPIRSLLFGSNKSSSSVSRSATMMSIPPSISAVSLCEEALAGRLWIKFNRECLFSMYSPFAVSLAAGNLKIETFRQYIAQDVHFLKAFAHAYELAGECADDDDDKLAISNLRKSVMDELKMHDSFVQDWDLDINKEVSVNSATLRYTEFLLATASGKVEGLKAPGMLDTPFEKTKVAAYTLGAVTPCMKLYAFLGKEFGALLDSSEMNHPYKKWIENYSSEAFQASAKQTEDLLEKLSVCMTGEELDIIENLYQQAMKLEVEFFHAQPLAQPTIVPLLKNHSKDELMIFSDFDLTCTVVDSSAILAEIAIVTAPKDDQGQQMNRMLSADLKNTWSLLSKQYTEHYEECIESILNKEKADKFDYEGLCEALEQLSEFEKKANDRVIESGVLKGLNLDDIKRAGERLILQDGCISVFQKILKTQDANAKLHVLSYCWCGDLIRAAFSARGVDAVEVHANEFTFEESISTGEIERKVESPIDKAQQFKSILENRKKEDKGILTVYIGDSVGDLLCLLEADIGIVVASSSSLRRVGSHFGVSFVPLFSGIVQKQKQEETWKGLSGTLYTVSSWAEIHSFALGWE
ncbi:putative aminopyrimidine aminohydrolase [Raphanus sativus]|uniref:Bifunctional TH2 protein, mitochondrial n=1 Tax=Raphanus sativus TaxID=3726 RepID=A0A6J0KX90_RAPSA|nr:bifunctional TH2 protein, mitochondrial [Raphanus sativus]KAJ4881311.1 putative aminopyrimidine aminohydrolase [Raphanus sativus]